MTRPLVDVTAPIVVTTLAEKAAAVERFALDADNVLDDWQVIIDPDLGDPWVIRWHYLRITVRDRSDLDLAIALARQRAEGLRLVRQAVAEARIALGWTRYGRVPVVRCLVCRTSDVAWQQHAPGSSACLDTQEERRVAHAD